MSHPDADPTRGQELPEFTEAPAFIPPEVIRETRRESRIDRELAFTRLRSACQVRGILDAPRYYTDTILETNARRQVLSLPLGDLSINNAEVLVVINSLGPDPEDPLGDTDKLEMTGFRFCLSRSRIAQSPTRVSRKHKTGGTWPFTSPAEFGPLIRAHEAREFLAVDYFNMAEDLPLPRQRQSRVSPQYQSECQLAEHLTQAIEGLEESSTRPFMLVTFQAEEDRYEIL